MLSKIAPAIFASVALLGACDAGKGGKKSPPPIDTVDPRAPTDDSSMGGNSSAGNGNPVLPTTTDQIPKVTLLQDMCRDLPLSDDAIIKNQEQYLSFQTVVHSKGLTIDPEFALKEIDLPQLVCMSGRLLLKANRSERNVRNVDIRNLEFIDDVYIQSASLENVAFPNLISVRQFRARPAVYADTLDLSQLRGVAGDFSIRSFEKVIFGPVFQVEGTVSSVDRPNDDLALNLKSAQNLDITGEQSSRLEFAELEIVGNIRIEKSGFLEAISFPKLKVIAGDLMLGGDYPYYEWNPLSTGNQLLSEITFGGLERIEGNIIVGENGEASSCLLWQALHKQLKAGVLKGKLIKNFKSDCPV
jgi:hypothetical protein